MNWTLLKLGWKRRNALILDMAGCPMWLNKWRCRHVPELSAIAKALEAPFADMTIEERREAFLQMLISQKGDSK